MGIVSPPKQEVKIICVFSHVISSFTVWLKNDLMCERYFSGVGNKSFEDKTLLSVGFQFIAKNE